jgi:hypothetical protein
MLALIGSCVLAVVAVIAITLLFLWLIGSFSW